MKLQALERCLRGAMADLALVNKHISRQLQLVVELEQSGQDAKIARIFLEEAEAVRTVYMADAARLEEQVGQRRAA